MSEPFSTFTLFVYGTLLPGEPSHALLADARELGPVKTRATYALIDLGPYPAMIEGGTTAVVGALYEVTAPMLAAIDLHEDLFKRRRVTLDTEEEAESYFLDADQVRGRRRIRSGDWRARFQPVGTPGLRDTLFARGMRNRGR